MKLYLSLGFEKVGTLKKHVHFDGRYLDQYVMEWHTKYAQGIGQ
jgi:RimJ/RimL family protein N-acetyltransferase